MRPKELVWRTDQEIAAEVLHVVVTNVEPVVTAAGNPARIMEPLRAAGCKVIGNVEVGRGAKVGAGSVVLEDVPPGVTVAGVPARVVGTHAGEIPSHDMDQTLR